MKNLLFGLIATVLFVNVSFSNELKGVKITEPIKIEKSDAGRGKIIKYLISAASAIGDWFSSSDPVSVHATGAYSNNTCDARNRNICNINFKVSNTIPLDILAPNTNSTVMNKIIANSVSFLAFDEYGNVYLAVPEKTNDKLFTSGDVKQINNAVISSEIVDYINKQIIEINPKANKFTGISANKVLQPFNNGEGFLLIQLN